MLITEEKTSLIEKSELAGTAN